MVLPPVRTHNFLAKPYTFPKAKSKGKKNQLPMLDYIFWSHYLQSLIISGFETFNSVKMLIIVVEIQC